LKVTSQNNFKLKGDEDTIDYKVKLKTAGVELTYNQFFKKHLISQGNSQLLFDIKNVSGLEKSGSYSDTLTVAFSAM
jgi:hypothetical protein